MKPLHDILIETYGHKHFINADNSISKCGQRDLKRLEQLFIDLEQLGFPLKADDCIRTLDNIVNLPF